METSSQVETIKSLLSNYSKRTKTVGQNWCDMYNLEEKDRFKLVGGRQRTTSVVRSVSRKLNEVPFKKGMSKSEYESMMNTWLPNLVCRFDGIHEKNVEGSAEALSVMMGRYPCLGLAIKGYGSVAGFRSSNKSGSLDIMKIEKEVRAKEDAKKNAEDFAEKALKECERTWIGNILYKWDIKRTGDLKKWLIRHGQYAQMDDEIREILRERLKEVHLRNAVEAEVVKLKQQGGDTVPQIEVPIVRNALGFYWPKTKAVYMTAKGKSNIDSLMGNAEKAGEFHPIVDKDQSGSKQAMVHELGHALDYFVGANSHPEMMAVWAKLSKKDITMQLSKYGSYNIEEMIAEAFCEYYCSKTPRPLSQKIVGIVNKLYDEKMKNIEKNDNANYGAQNA